MVTRIKPGTLTAGSERQESNLVLSHDFVVLEKKETFKAVVLRVTWSRC